MAPDRLQLIQLLCTEAGMIMEDASVEAVRIVSPADDRREEQLALLSQEAADIGALIAAAAVLHRRPR